MTLELPSWFAASGAVWHKVGVSRSGGRSISGNEKVVGSGSGFWRASIEAPVHGEDRTLAWRAFLAAVDGMATEFLVPCVSRWRSHDINGRMLSAAGAASLEPASLHNLAGFSVDEPELVFSNQEAAVRSTRLRIFHPGVDGPRPGHYFGIGERLSLISRVWQLDHERRIDGGGTLTYGGETLTYDGASLTYGAAQSRTEGRNISMIDFWPGLREAVPMNTPLILGRPMCRMRMASDDTGALDQPYGIAGTVTLDLVEAI